VNSSIITGTIAAVPPTIAAAAALIVSLRNKAAIREVHLTINSRLDQLIQASVAQGRQDERDANKQTGTP
jgi:hypothetical protein